MPNPERGEGPSSPDHQPAHEAEPRPYQRASRFAGERGAGVAYTAAQQVLYEATGTDLSVYRLQLNRLWYVAALGLVPPAPLLQAIARILDTGDPADLPSEVWQTLSERRDQATRQGPWTEGHYRPGWRL